MRQGVYVTVFVIRPAGGAFELLLGLRAPGRYMAGTWQPVAGHVEPGETVVAAALRELKEETDLTPASLYRLTTIGHFYLPHDDSINVAPMFCAVVSAEASAVLSEEHTAFDWVDLPTAAGRLTWPVDRTACAEVAEQIAGDGPLKSHLRIGGL